MGDAAVTLEILIRRYSTILVDDLGVQHGHWSFTGGLNRGWVGRYGNQFTTWNEWLAAADAYTLDLSPATD